MIKISAEFESPELAELAVKRIKETTDGIHSSSVIYNKVSDKAMHLRNGNIYTIIPTAVTVYNYLTLSMESPASEDVVAEPYRSRKAYVSIYCEQSSSANIHAVLNAMGALKISIAED